MEKKAFKALLKSIAEARAIHAGTRKPDRVTRIGPLKVKAVRRKRT